MNGDDRLDVIASHPFGSPTVFGSDFVSILAGSGAGGLGSPVVAAASARLVDIGDRRPGRPERRWPRRSRVVENSARIASCCSSAMARAALRRNWCRTPRPGSFAWSAATSMATDRCDLVFSTTRGAAVQLGDGDGNFAAPVLHAAAASGEVRVVDVNGDGRLDIVDGQWQWRRTRRRGRAAEPVRPAVHRSFPERHRYSGSGCRRQHRHLHGDDDEPGCERCAGHDLYADAAVGLHGDGIFEHRHVHGPASRVVSCNLGLLAPSASATVDVVLTTTRGTTLTTVATVSSNSADSNPANNSVTTDTVVTAGSRQIAVINTNDSGPGSLRQAITTRTRTPAIATRSCSTFRAPACRPSRRSPRCRRSRSPSSSTAPPSLDLPGCRSSS